MDKDPVEQCTPFEMQAMRLALTEAVRPRLRWRSSARYSDGGWEKVVYGRLQGDALVPMAVRDLKFVFILSQPWHRNTTMTPLAGLLPS